jgi:Cupin-like domain
MWCVFASGLVFGDPADMSSSEQRHDKTGLQAEGNALTIRPDEDAELVPFATWDPDKVEENSTPFSYLSKPMRVDLEPGDMLYLPALW